MRNKGITLIALIITIIVLLILAGVALATLTGQGNIVENANKAVEKYNEKELAEQGLLNEIEKKLIEYSNGGVTSTDTPAEPETPPSVDATTGLATAPYTIQPDETNPNLQIVIPAGFAPAVLTSETDGSVEHILVADQWNSITATQINQGIVVVDHAITYTDGVPDFNEYVWVPITGSGENIFARKAWNGPHWTTNYQSTGEHPIAEVSAEDKSNKYWDNSTEYTNMKNSINTNKGFYISRYEASNNGNDVAQSKRGQTPWIYVSQTDAITAARNANPTVHTHLMYGVEWDSTLRWLIYNNNKTGSEIQTNSSGWGHYNSSSKQNTGYSETWKANNIYDLAGNVWEWTQEKYSTGSYRALRGGYFEQRWGHLPGSCSCGQR